MKKLWYFILETRAGILATTAIPVMLGSAVAYNKTGLFSPYIFWLILGGYCLIHLGTNVINDYFDAIGGTDNINTGFIAPFTGGGRMLQKRKLSPREIFYEAVILFIAASALFIAASVKSGAIVLWPAAAGMAAGIFYSAPPLKISGSGFGEILIAMVFGPLLSAAAYAAQTKELSLIPAAASILPGLLTAAFVILAEFPDYDADRATGKKNLVVRLGKKNGILLFGAVLAVSYGLEAWCVHAGYIPKSGLWALSGAIFSVCALIELLRKHATPGKLGLACFMSLAAHLTSGAALVLAFTPHN